MRILRLLTMVFFALACDMARAQSLITMSQSGPAHSARAVSWSLTAGSLGAALTWAPVSGTNYACFTIANNAAVSSHTANVFVYESSDPAPFNFTGAGLNTFLLSPLMVQTLANSTNVNFAQRAVSNQSSHVFSAPIPAAAQAFIVITTGGAGGVGDSFDLTEVDSPTPCVAPAPAPAYDSTNGRGCGQIFNGFIATGTQVLVGNASVPLQTQTYGGNPRWHICAYQISGAAGTTAANLAFNWGDSANTCLRPVDASSWVIRAGVGIPNYALSGGGREIFSLPGNQSGLCFQDVGTGTGVELTVVFDYW